MTAETVPVLQVAGLRRSVADLARSVDFYCGALGFEPVESAVPHANGGRSAMLRLGLERIELVGFDPAAVPPSAFAPDPRFQHAAIVARDIEAAWRRLTTFAPTPISTGGPERLPANTGGVTAFKFRDPDGHPLELIAFPPGTGDTRWHQPATALTLGIDHFAVVVADADRSIAFYGTLGFRATSRQVNQGAEQARLDGLATAVVEVVALTLTGMATGPTPHLELLCYRTPHWDGVTTCEASPAFDVIALTTAHGALIERVDPDGHELSMSSKSMD